MIARIDGRKCAIKAIKCKLVQDEMTRMREITLKEKSPYFVLISPNHPSLPLLLSIWDSSTEGKFQRQRDSASAGRTEPRNPREREIEVVI